MITITTFLNLVERKYGNDTKATVNRYIKLKEKIKTHEYENGNWNFRNIAKQLKP